MPPSRSANRLLVRPNYLQRVGNVFLGAALTLVATLLVQAVMQLDALRYERSGRAGVRPWGQRHKQLVTSFIEPIS